MRKVCEFMQGNDHEYSINLTADDLQTKKDVERLFALASSYSIDPERITFEILEEIDIFENQSSLENIKILKSYGFKIAIDDFGTHHANFLSILSLEPDTIKIDMKYVRDIDTRPKNASLVRAITLFAHDNNIEVVAE